MILAIYGSHFQDFQYALYCISSGTKTLTWTLKLIPKNMCFITLMYATIFFSNSRMVAGGFLRKMTSLVYPKCTLKEMQISRKTRIWDVHSTGNYVVPKTWNKPGKFPAVYQGGYHARSIPYKVAYFLHDKIFPDHSSVM